MVDSTKTHGAVAAGPTPTVEIVKQPGGRPDQKHHNGEMDRLKSEIDQTHAKIAQIRAPCLVNRWLIPHRVSAEVL